MVRKKRKKLLITAGVLYIVFGILAFFNIPGGHDEHHHTYAHNLTHIVLGCVLLAVTLKSPPRIRQFLCFGFAIGYLVIGSLGVLTSKSATLAVLPGVVEFHAGDYAVHFATGFLFFVLGMLRRSDQPREALSETAA